MRLFTSILLLGLLAGNAPAQTSTECPLDRDADETVIVKRVIDGDTLLLSDGRQLRFTSVNAPELSRKSRPAEPNAQQAKQALDLWLAKDNTLQLRFDKKRHDHYQRLLAHPFLSDGRNLQALLLKEGLAAHIVEPPGLWSQTCYARLEQEAQQLNKGMWASERFAAINASELSSRNHGYYRVTGQVERVWSNGRVTWLVLSDRLSLRIEQEDLKYFKHFSPEALRSHEVEAKGWVFPYLDGLNLRIKHPGALRILD